MARCATFTKSLSKILSLSEDVTFESVSKKLETLALVSALMLGFVTSTLFVCSRDEMVAADAYFGSKFSSTFGTPSKAVVWYGSFSMCFNSITLACTVLLLFVMYENHIDTKEDASEERKREAKQHVHEWNAMYFWPVLFLLVIFVLGVVAFFNQAWGIVAVKFPFPANTTSTDGNDFYEDVFEYTLKVGLTVTFSFYLIYVIYATAKMKRGHSKVTPFAGENQGGELPLFHKRERGSQASA